MSDLRGAGSRTRRPGAAAGVGHTRWATHGEPTTGNAHPHLDCTGRLALVHNGIIENYAELADELGRPTGTCWSPRPTRRSSPTWSSRRWPAGIALAEGLRRALRQVRGSFAVAAVHADEPDLVVAARRVSPLIVGVGDGASFLASDIPALLGSTRQLFALEDDQLAELRPGAVRVTDAGRCRRRARRR